ncbi:MAG: hypothetical protein ACRCTM_08130, partial [Sphaerotilus sulfidivorans]
PVLEPYLSSTVRVKESHEQSLPMIHLDPKHRLTQEFVALHARLEPGLATPQPDGYVAETRPTRHDDR